MSDLFWLTEDQMNRLRPFFPRSHGKPRVDDRRVLSGIIFINCNGLRWCDAPAEYGPSKTLYNRRNRIEIMFGKLKNWRRVATRYDRCPEVFLSAVALAATVIFWLKNSMSLEPTREFRPPLENSFSESDAVKS